MGGGYKCCNNPLNLRADEVSIRRLRLARSNEFWQEFQSYLFSPLPTMLSEKQRFIFSCNTFPTICFRNRNEFYAWDLEWSLLSYLWLIKNYKLNAASVSSVLRVLFCFSFLLLSCSNTYLYSTLNSFIPHYYVFIFWCIRVLYPIFHPFLLSLHSVGILLILSLMYL